ncbi:hypothetical protein [Ruminococcus flavefaciens]|uniref:hypothetical protein n=1 Tax=Ruminococcus flavefaciens TaxID=1265 RepID=UPI0013D97F91|nr:hypothetical protein [Ruminococcus flavefaciens]
MDHRTVYMLIRELSNEEARKHLMTDAEFAMLPPDEQLNEVNRAVNAANIDRSLLHMAYSTPPPNEKESNSSKRIMIITAVSMIIGFIIICSAFFFHESNSELAGLIVAAGLILAAGVPAVCYAVDKIRTELAQKRAGNSTSFSKYDADTNFSSDTPPKKVLWTGALGVTMVTASLLTAAMLRGKAFGFTFGALFFVGFALLSVSFKLSKKRDTAIILNLPSLLGLFLLMIQTADTAKLEIISDFREKCTITYYIIIALMPLIYNIVKLLRCREKVDAKCIDVEAVKLRHYSKKEYYRIYWSYSCNEKGYVHKDLLSFWESSEGDKIRLRVNPKDPHDIYRVKLPGFCMLMMLFCCALAVFAFSTASGNPTY